MKPLLCQQCWHLQRCAVHTIQHNHYQYSIEESLSSQDKASYHTNLTTAFELALAGSHPKFQQIYRPAVILLYLLRGKAGIALVGLKSALLQTRGPFLSLHE